MLRRFLALALVTTLAAAAPGAPPAHAGHGSEDSRPRIVLITSLDTHLPAVLANGPLNPSYFDDYVPNLELLFAREVRRSGLDVDLVIVHDATADGIARVLQSGRNVAVFYVAHAGFASAASAPGLAGTQLTITDYFHNDVTPAFQKIHPNLRYLALEGCRGARIVEALRATGAYFQSPRLEVLASPDEVPALSATLGDLRHVLNRLAGYTPPSSCGEELGTEARERQGYRVRIRRELSEDYPERGRSPGAIMLTMGDRLIATFPPGLPGETQTASAWIDAGRAASPSDLKITARSGSKPGQSRETIEIGRLSIEPLWQGTSTWHAFESHGQPLGVSENTYEYDGEFPISAEPERYESFPCILLDPIPLPGGWTDFDW